MRSYGRGLRRKLNRCLSYVVRAMLKPVAFVRPKPTARQARASKNLPTLKLRVWHSQDKNRIHVRR